MANQMSKHYTRIFQKWPVDLLRPNQQFQSLLSERIKSGAPKGGTDAAEVNAAYLLLENRFSKTFPLSQTTMQPASNPEYFSLLKKTLDEAPNRTRFQNFIDRLRGMIRWK